MQSKPYLQHRGGRNRDRGSLKFLAPETELGREGAY